MAFLLLLNTIKLRSHPSGGSLLILRLALTTCQNLNLELLVASLAIVNFNLRINIDAELILPKPSMLMPFHPTQQYASANQ